MLLIKMPKKYTFHRVDASGECPDPPTITHVDEKRLEWLKNKQKEGRELLKRIKYTKSLKEIKELYDPFENSVKKD